MKNIHNILHPTDFSPHAKAAFDFACSVARDFNARLIVLHVIPSHEPVTHYGKVIGLEPPDVAQTDLRWYRQEMEQKLRTVKPQGGQVDIEYMLKEGVISKVIVQTMEQASSDMIVMGSRGQSPPSRAMFGSVAEEVANTASCPVVTVHAPRR